MVKWRRLSAVTKRRTNDELTRLGLFYFENEDKRQGFEIVL